jgi:hypothetical protein
MGSSLRLNQFMVCLTTVVPDQLRKGFNDLISRLGLDGVGGLLLQGYGVWEDYSTESTKSVTDI